MLASNEVRALETAKIYKDEAEKRGFQIISVPQKQNDIGCRITKGDVKTSSRLSINSQNIVADNVFMPADKRFKINFDKLSPEVRKRYDAALAIVDQDNKGSYGANLVAYGDEIKKIFPEIRTSEQIEKEKLGVLIKNFRTLAKKMEKLVLKSVLKFLHLDIKTKWLDS